MKKILLALMLSCTVIGFAQNENRQKRLMEDFTPEQQATLKTKKMVLDLDLNDSQKSQIMALHKKWTKEAASKKEEIRSMNKDEMTATQKFDLMNTALDTKISHQQQLKKILNKEQYDRWRNSSEVKHSMLKHKMRSASGKNRKGPKN